MSTGKRFRTFLDNIRLTDKQKTDGSDSRENVVSTLNRHYYGSSSGTSNSQYIGSWAKRTRIRPPRDVDIIFTLPESVYTRYQSRSGNKQSQILQEVKGVLADKFYSTSIKGSGPVVIIPFSAYAVEVAPAFLLTTGQHYICMTEGGGHYKAAAYAAEAEHIATSNQSTNNNTRDLIRMMKRWQAYCSVSIKSFHIELMAVEFISSWAHKGQTTLYYDLMVRDFLEYLLGRVNGTVYAPGTYEAMNLGSAWQSKANSALASAKLACAEEAKSAWEMAGIYWQQVFGPDIPRNS